MVQIKDLAITKTSAEDTDLFVLQNPTTGETYSITKADLFSGLSSGGGSGTDETALTYSSNGDDNGLFYYLGTNGKTTFWVNPATTSALIVTASSTEGGSPVGLSDRSASEYYSNISANNWIKYQIDTGKKLKCNYYSIRSRANNVDYYPRNWILQGSNDGSTWTDLDTQVNNTTISSISQWLSLPVTSTTAYSYFRLLQNGVDSSGVGYLCLGEIELYGLYY
ncbi:discoidin domain-containing protein [Nostoc sp. ATCC 53789]|uniref:discoidin domain-containing protein n=1 Tax=Nostoc sp. ATCC 53789 TaxID=76335 RepID=UPI000DECD2C4|nr:discoidin domain-containing protein [Nostoc sp. ATCC 53789]QHG15809.1 hypothetical protein GJB62_07385 [Nostoc sp. ATCC 53789]RCJ27751.1 hypothetical protein A6V25_17785 [Nostoc sp. ATCC 53789]